MTPSKPEPVKSEFSGIDSPGPATDASRRSQQAMRDSYSNRTPQADGEAPQAGSDEGGPGYPVTSYPSTTPAMGDSAHLLDYVRVLYRRRYVALTAFTLVVVLVTVYTFTKTPIYQASVQIEIDYASPKVVPFQQVTDSQYRRVRLPGVLPDPVQDPAEPQPRAPDARLGESLEEPAARPCGCRRGAAPSVVGRGFSPANPANAAPADPAPGTPSFAVVPETPAQTPIINAFLEGVTVSPIRNSRLVDLKYSSTDPQLAATVANAMARNYIEQTLEYKFLSSREASDWLGQQLTEQRKQVEASEQALQRYREQTDSVSLEDKQNITVQKLADLNAAVTKAKTERLQKEALYKQVTAIEHDRAALDTFPAILASPFIQQLKGQAADLQRQRASLAEKYGEKHPEMIRLQSQIQDTDAKIQGEIAKVVQSIRTEYKRRSRRRTAWSGRSSSRRPRRWRSAARGSTTACCSATPTRTGRCSTPCCSGPRRRGSARSSSPPTSGSWTRPPSPRRRSARRSS